MVRRPSGNSSPSTGDGDRPRQALHRHAGHLARRDRHRPRRRQGAEDGEQLRLPGAPPLLRRGHLPPHHQRVHVPGRRPHRDRTGRAGLPLRRRAAQARRVPVGSVAMANWPAPTPTAASSSSSPATRRRPAAEYSPFGQIVKGLEVLDRCSASAPAAATVRPTTSSSTPSRSPSPTDHAGDVRSPRRPLAAAHEQYAGSTPTAAASPSAPPRPAWRQHPFRAAHRAVRLPRRRRRPGHAPRRRRPCLRRPARRLLGRVARAPRRGRRRHPRRARPRLVVRRDERAGDRCSPRPWSRASRRSSRCASPTPAPRPT